MDIDEKTENGYFFQFDAYCRKVVKFNGCAMRRNEQAREAKMPDCIAFDEAFIATACVEDNYRILFPKIVLQNITVYIEDENLYRHLRRLPRKRLEILILSYFLGLSDSEIGKRLKLAKSTVQHNRKMALVSLRKDMNVSEKVMKKTEKNKNVI